MKINLINEYVWVLVWLFKKKSSHLDHFEWKVFARYFFKFRISNNIKIEKKTLFEIYFFGPPNGCPLSFPRSLTPRARSNFAKICWFGMALACSYSLIICAFSFIS